jgi:hypothetical protein
MMIAGSFQDLMTMLCGYAWLVGLMVSGLAGASVVPAPDSSPIPGLLQADAEILIEYLGEGVVGEPVVAPPIDDPSSWFPFEQGTLTYRISGGRGKGSMTHHVYRWVDKREGELSEHVGKDQTVFFGGFDGGGISVEGEITHRRDKLTRFSPGKPMIPRGIRLGEECDLELSVEVFTLPDIERASYSGSVDATCAYLGAFEVNVPSGRYVAVLFRWTNEGKVGPASVDETEYRFLAQGVGTVAMVVNRSVDAYLVYRSRSNTGKVLVRSGPTAEAERHGS